MSIRYLTAGESHGPALTAIIEGIPAGLTIDITVLQNDFKRRQEGYGRGGRMKIETDTAEILSGIRFGKTLGSPITLLVRNKDWANWTEKMSITPLKDYANIKQVTQPRPGHVDLGGIAKYGFEDMRNVLERASARETTMRVAVGSISKMLLKELGIDILGYVTSIGTVACPPVPEGLSIPQIREKTEISPFRCYHLTIEEKLKEAVDTAKRDGDTLGGIIEVIADGLPIGLGSYVQWDRKLDGRLAQAIMSIQAIKGVEIGMGFDSARKPGSQVHDPFTLDDGKIKRTSNHAGGLEGGVTNGNRLVIRAAMKPIATLMKPLESVDMKTQTLVKAAVERSDICAVPAAAVIAECVTAVELANTLIEKFGGDSIPEIKRNLEGYLKNLPIGL